MCLDGLASVARIEAAFSGLKVRFAAEYLAAEEALAPPVSSGRERTAHQMSTVAEVACVLSVSERSAGALLSQAVALTTSLPLTLAALEGGRISWQHARVMVDEAANLDAAGAAGLEGHFLAPYFPGVEVPDPARGCPAGDLVPGRFRARARTWRERHHRESIEARHGRCVADRRVEFVPDNDGMAWFNTYLPADTAAGIWARTTAEARALQSPSEGRTLAQLRADVAATLLLSGDLTPTRTAGTDAVDAGAAGTGADAKTSRDAVAGVDAGAGDCVGGVGGVVSPRAQVLVMVPVLSLLGVTEEPAALDGYGPIPPSMARRLVAEGAGSFYRVLTDPRDGAPLEIGRTSYRPSRAQRQWLRLRDGTCPFPGCNNHSLDNDADHLLAWADGGTTGISNLGQPCRKHHSLKHATAWTPTGADKDHPPGWISPTGRTYPSEHQDWEPPHLPDELLALAPPRNAEPAPDQSNDDPGLPPDPGPGEDTGLPPDPGPWFDPSLRPVPEPDDDTGLPPDPGPDSNQQLPEDPFPDWYRYIAA